jgi:hypothetical protein
MKSMRRRIGKLQEQARMQAPAGCDTCRSWAGIVLMDDVGNLSRPDTCPGCGRAVPIFRILHIVGVPLDVL